jgi:hypothetical protein
MAKLQKGELEWRGDNGKKMDAWTPMVGSLRFVDFNEFCNFVQAFTAVFPYCDNAPITFIKGLLVVVQELRIATTSAGRDLGDKKLEATFRQWGQNRNDPSLVAVAKTSAAAEGVEDFPRYLNYLSCAITTMRNVFFLEGLYKSMVSDHLSG